MPESHLSAAQTSRPPTATRHVAVCICTYKRLPLLRRLLEALERQRCDASITFGIVVADNDAKRSAENLVTEFGVRSKIGTTYCCESIQNIALVRNRAIANATGDLIAFLDDDEFPNDDWLMNLVSTLDHFSASGVLGPVRPHFENTPPSWIVKGGFCERPEYPTGTKLDWAKCRTGNVLFRRAILSAGTPPFRIEFGTGGEDVDFFQRMADAGCVFVWCNEAPAYETVPPSRWTRRFMLQRALLRGKNSFERPDGRAALLLKSLVATPLYLLFLPITLLMGQHRFMKYSIKLCDHLGRLLAWARINPMTSRPM